MGFPGHRDASVLEHVEAERDMSESQEQFQEQENMEEMEDDDDNGEDGYRSGEEDTRLKKVRRESTKLMDMVAGC